jgi:hypothetical protein
MNHSKTRQTPRGLIIIIKANEIHYISTLFGKELYVFRTDLLSNITSLNTVFTEIGIFHTSMLSSASRRQHTSMTYTYCCEYSIKTPDDGQ